MEMHMRITILGTALAIGVALPVMAQQTTKEQLVGTWSVTSLKATSEGQASYPLGEKPAGYMTMTPTRMWLLFVDPARKPPAGPNLSEAEAVAMMKTQVAWTGKYSVGEQTPDGLKITAHVDATSNQAIAGMDRVYFVLVNGDKIVFKSPGVVVPMTGKMSVVEFEMTKTD